MRNAIWAALFVLVGCSPEVGSDAWCEKMMGIPRNEWSMNESLEFAKSCSEKILEGLMPGKEAAAAPSTAEQVRKARTMMENLRNALDMFQLDVGRYPTDEEGLEALRQRPSTAARWSGPYLRDELPSDPWGNSFAYRSRGTGYAIVSFGEDGREGGAGAAADIEVSG